MIDLTNSSSLDTQTYDKSQVSSEDVLNIYVSSTGIISLVLDRINAKYFPHYAKDGGVHYDEVDLLQALSQPHLLAKFESITKAQIYMRTFSAANQALSTLEATISKLEPYEISKTVTNLIDKINELSKHTQDQDGMNVNNFVFNNLIPQEAQLAIQYLQNKPKPTLLNEVSPQGRDEIIEHEELFTLDETP